MAWPAPARSKRFWRAAGADLFDITMFGDEPYGNYNRILLSAILDGSQDRDSILINPLSWYSENGITLHSGERVVELDRLAKVVTSDKGTRVRYDKLMIATGSRAFIPPIKGVHNADGALKTASSAIAPSTTPKR